MSRERIIRLIQCIVVPFVGMFASGRLMGWLLAGLGLADWVRDFGSFLAAALLAAFLYRCLDPVGWENVFRESVGEPCTLPLAFCQMGYGFLWLMGIMAVVQNLFAPPMQTDRTLAGAIVSAVLVHPILEEWLFRRVFMARLLDLADGEIPAPEVVAENAEAAPQRKYTRAGMLFAVLTQAVLFALMHTGGPSMLYGFGGGVVLGVLMLRTGRLWVPVAVHMAINLRSVIWPVLSQSLTFVMDMVLIIAGVCCGLLFWGLRIRRFRRQKTEDAS